MLLSAPALAAGEGKGWCAPIYRLVSGIKALLKPEPREWTPREQAENRLIAEREARPAVRQRKFQYAYYTFTTLPTGQEMLVTARVRAQGEVLHLWEFTIRHTDGSNFERVEIGPRETRRLLDQFLEEVRQTGFSLLVIEGQRITGARMDHYRKAREALEADESLDPRERSRRIRALERALHMRMIIDLERNNPTPPEGGGAEVVPSPAS